MHETTFTVQLQLDELDGVLSGHIDARGKATPFHGWVGLVAALDRVLSAEREARRDGDVLPHSQGDAR